MILALDPSALVQRYTGGPYSAVVNQAMTNAKTWAISDLARAELLMALHRLAPNRRTATAFTAAARADIDAMVVVPIDGPVLSRSIELGTLYTLRTVDAVHLAALDRLPRPLAFATLDARQMPAAVALEMELITPRTSPPALPADQRPFDNTPVHTADLPPTPTRDRNIAAEAWIEAPAQLLAAGDDIGGVRIAYKRRLGPWLLWRAGPARGADARYVAVHCDDLTRVVTFCLFANGTGDGSGPSGAHHTRFRSWKQDLHATP